MKGRGKDETLCRLYYSDKLIAIAIQFDRQML